GRVCRGGGRRRATRRDLDGPRQGLHERGWVEGRNFIFEARFAEGRTDQLSVLAADLVRLKMDLIATTSTPAALAAKHATTTIPIVIGFVADPVGSGIVARLAHPAQKKLPVRATPPVGEGRGNLGPQARGWPGGRPALWDGGGSNRPRHHGMGYG